jgi:hypothetical protein
MISLIGESTMYAHRQIYDHVQDSVPVPEQMRNQRVEVVFMALDEEPASAQNMTGFGTQMASFFRDIHPDEVPVARKDCGAIHHQHKYSRMFAMVFLYSLTQVQSK